MLIVNQSQPGVLECGQLGQNFRLIIKLRGMRADCVIGCARCSLKKRLLLSYSSLTYAKEEQGRHWDSAEIVCTTTYVLSYIGN